MLGNFYYFKTKHIPSQKNAGSSVPDGTKVERYTKTSEISPVTFICRL